MPKKEKEKENKEYYKSKRYNCSNCGGAFYFLGFMGALVYNLSTVTGFWNIVLGILKAIVWPAFVVYHLMKFLGM